MNPALIVIFGASGDLAYRKLMPALYTLCAEGHLPEDYAILGVARSDYSDEEFRDHLWGGIEKFARLNKTDKAAWERFSQRVYYHSLPAYDALDGYTQLRERIDALDSDHHTQGNILFYLSTPPSLYSIIPELLSNVQLNHGSGWRRIIIEKPFGTDLASAEKLNKEVHTHFDEDQIYRIDHYLGKETVQNLMVFRFANALFEPLWNRHHIDHVQISALESVDVGSRAGYYDHAGVLRDMFQNHIMQLLTLTAMEAPADFAATPLRDEKVKVLRSLDMIEPDQVNERTVRAQYNGYLNAEGVPDDSQTPTFAALKFYINNWRWQGVPFFLRSGKAVKTKTTEIVVQFRSTPLKYFAAQDGTMPQPDRLAICLQPDEGFHLRMSVKQPGAGFQTKPVDMTFHFEDAFGKSGLPDAYERLLLDALQGDASLFARSDEIEMSWRIIDKILEGWHRADAAPLATYAPGSWGPTEAEDLLGGAPRSWYHGCAHIKE